MASKICVFTSSAFSLEDAVEDFNKNIDKKLITVLFDKSQINLARMLPLSSVERK